jgi:PadR family transcriptional regulator PadR
MNSDQKLAPLRKGLLEFVVLKLLSGPALYVADLLRALAATDFATQEGTLYPLLSRLRREGLVDYEWRESQSGPPRKYYRLTETGATQLAEFQAYWDRLHATLLSLGQPPCAE